jgi:hypothetical protein
MSLKRPPCTLVFGGIIFSASASSAAGSSSLRVAPSRLPPSTGSRAGRTNNNTIQSAARPNPAHLFIAAYLLRTREPGQSERDS